MAASVEFVGFTPEEVAYLKEFIREHMGKPRGVAPVIPEPRNRLPDFYCKAKTTFERGPLTRATHKVSVMKGPGHPDGEVELYELGVDYAWHEADINTWLGGHNHYGYYYVTPVECPTVEL